MSNQYRFTRRLMGAGVMLLVISGATPHAPVLDGPASCLNARAVFAAETTWKEDFDDICGKTQDAMSLSPDELRALIKRCDELKVKVDALDGAAKKVAQKRLQMCRDLYAYVLDQKEKK